MTGLGQTSIREFCESSYPGVDTECELDVDEESELPPIRVWFEGGHTSSDNGGYGYVVKTDGGDRIDGGGYLEIERRRGNTIEEDNNWYEKTIARFKGLLNAARHIDRTFVEPETVFFGISPTMISAARGRPSEFDEYRDAFLEFRMETEWSHIELQALDFDDFDDLPPEYEEAMDIAYEYARGDRG